MFRVLLCGVGSFCVLLATALPAGAHPVPFSYLDLRLSGQPAGEIEGSLVVHIFDVAHDLTIDPPERLLDAACVDQQAAAIVALFRPRLVINAGGRPASAQWSQVEILTDRQSLRVHVRYALDSAPGAVTVTAAMFPYDPAHQTFVNIYDGKALTQAILDHSHPQITYFTGTRQGALAAMRKFLPAGIQHILIGPEHILFLVGLLLLGGSLRQLVVVVTSFTFAHSVTLSLAALNLVTPPGRIVEPAIALSIIYVGADNLLVRDGRDVRAWIALAFGFIHGFAFATVIKEMDLPARAIGWSLVSITVGVEIGQLIVVAAVASVLGALRSRSEAVGRRLAFAGSIVVMAAGTFWFIQRVFFPGGVS